MEILIALIAWIVILMIDNVCKEREIKMMISDICMDCENLDIDRYGYSCMVSYPRKEGEKCKDYKLSGCRSWSDEDPMVDSPLSAKPTLDK